MLLILLFLTTYTIYLLKNLHYKIKKHTSQMKSFPSPSPSPFFPSPFSLFLAVYSAELALDRPRGPRAVCFIAISSRPTVRRLAAPSPSCRFTVRRLLLSPYGSPTAIIAVQRFAECSINAERLDDCLQSPNR